MKKLALLILVLGFSWSAALAVPAKPGTQTYTQSDGTTITVQAVGDEWLHSIITEDGITVERAANGDFYYRTPQGMSNVMAHREGERTADEQSFLAANRDRLNMSALVTPAVKARRASARKTSGPRKVGGSTDAVTKGSPRIPVLVVEFSDKKLSNDISAFKGDYVASVNQYFKDMSNGEYDPQFEIFGPYTLPSTRATYGGNDSSGNDKGLGTMIYDACQKAAGDVNFSNYDNDNDGYADVVIVLYAGVGEAQASTTVKNSVWPCFWDMASAYYYGLSSNDAFKLNGVTINNFAVFNEVHGSRDSGTTLDGVGTFCHEFSHFLGLPDYYETTYSHGYYGMDYWSVMNLGCYNNDSYTPIGYGAYEKNFMGWLDLIEPEENHQYTLGVFNSGNVATDNAVKITSHLNENEYFIGSPAKTCVWDSPYPKMSETL